MDKFDLQITMLKPKDPSVHLDERLFMKKITQVRRARQIRRALMALMAFAALVMLAGALRRNVFEVLTLTFRYFRELPTLFGEFFHAYTATISWPSMLAFVLLVAVGVMLVRARKDIAAIHSKRTYRLAAMASVFALGLGIAGLFGSSSPAYAQQEVLRRSLNARGHLEVRVGDKDYEVYGKTNATDESLRKQAIIEQIRSFDISQAYPELKNLSRDGFVAEIRAVNPKDDCVFYTERRLEPALNVVLDANAGCIRSDQKVYYLDSQLKPVAKPMWNVGQATYFSNAQNKDSSPSYKGMVGIVILLDGKADEYIARSNSEKLIPKGQPGTGVTSCGIDLQEVCPETGGVDVFTNAEGHMAYGEIGSSVPGNSLKPRPDTVMQRMFGKITVLTDQKLQITSPSGKTLTVAWPRNYIQEFNNSGAQNYPTTSGPLKIQTGDHLTVTIYYKDGMNLDTLSDSDLFSISLAIKTTMPDALNNETYDKSKLSDLIEKY